MAVDDVTKKLIRKAYLERNKQRIAEVKRNWRIRRVPKCHPDRKHKALGLCLWCYANSGHRRNNKVKATCHPERAHQAKGLCKTCYMAQFLCTYERPQASIDRKREYHWRRSGIIGMTVSIFNEMLEKQNNACAICLSTKTLYVDHDHETGLVRGLLCDYCNRRLLIGRNSIETLKRAVDYLERAKKVTPSYRL